MVALAKLPRLKSLDLSKCTSLTNLAAEALGNCTSLTNLELNEIDGFSDDGALALAKCKLLQCVGFVGTALGDLGLLALATGCPHLELVTISRCNVTRGACRQAVKLLPNMSLEHDVHYDLWREEREARRT